MPYISNAYRGARIPPSRMAIVAVPQASEPKPKTKPGRGPLFTPDEDAALLRLRKQGMSWRFISAKLRRPLGSCYTRYCRLVTR